MNKPILLVNVSIKAAIKDYVHNFGRENLVVFNEVYPPLDEEEIAIIKSIGNRLYHIIGVKAKAYPSFPSAYKGGISCCGAWNAGPNLKVIVRRLI